MTLFRQLSLFAFLLVGLISAAVAADAPAAGKLVPVTKSTDAAWLAQAQASYPIDTCTVSGDKLGADMGKPFVFVYKGQEVKLCCSMCKAEFDKDPKKYIKIIRAADKPKN